MAWLGRLGQGDAGTWLRVLQGPSHISNTERVHFGVPSRLWANSWHPAPVGCRQLELRQVGVVPGSAAGAANAAKPAPARQARAWPVILDVRMQRINTYEVIADAIAAGYRCFDCAQFYENEAGLGGKLS